MKKIKTAEIETLKELSRFIGYGHILAAHNLKCVIPKPIACIKALRCNNVPPHGKYEYKFRVIVHK